MDKQFNVSNSKLITRDMLLNNQFDLYSM